MIDLHAIFRPVGGGRWQTYSRPDSIYVAADNLDDVRRQFMDAAEFHFDEEWPDVTVYVHTEREVAPGVYVRVAVDEKQAARQHTAKIVQKSLDVPESTAIARSRALHASTGDVIFVCCEPDDRISWVSGQLGRGDAFQVCAPLAGEGIWWMPLAAPGKGVPASESETLADAGLGNDTAVVGQLPEAATKFAERAKLARNEITAAAEASFGLALPTLIAS